jgi:hypothetical protein
MPYADPNNPNTFIPAWRPDDADLVVRGQAALELAGLAGLIGLDDLTRPFNRYVTAADKPVVVPAGPTPAGP